MIEFFKRYPSKFYTRFCLVVGFIVFIGIYSYMLKLFQGFGFSMEEYNEVWLSFDAMKFRDFIQPIVKAGQESAFLNIFKLNILSISAFMLAFYSLSLMIARNIDYNSRLYKIAYIFPFLPILIAIFDIIPSILILTCKATLTSFPDWLAYVVSGGYAIRVILLYLVIIWFVLMLIWLIIKKLRK
jgi:hypothetical protein